MVSGKAVTLMGILLITRIAASKGQTINQNADTVLIKRAETVYLEGLGPGLFYSVNYDTRFGNKRDGIGARIGFSYQDFDMFTIPLQLNYLVPDRPNWYFEFGVGATYTNIDRGLGNDAWLRFTNSGLWGSATVGYRYQPVNGGFNFRVASTPIFSTHFVAPYWVGLSVGYTFK